MLFPKLGVHLGKTRFSESGATRISRDSDDMRVSLALIPLLSRQVVVDQIQLDGLRAGLVKHKDGKTNFDDLLGGEKGGEKKAAPVPFRRLPRPDAGADQAGGRGRAHRQGRD